MGFHDPSRLLPLPIVTWLSVFKFQFVQDHDEVTWCPTNNGKFTLASGFDECRQRQQSHSELHCLWSYEIPLKLSIFGWRILNGLYPFPEMLTRLGFSLASKCYACSSLDSMEHCFANCFLAKQVWFFFETQLRFNILQGGLYQTFRYCWQFPSHINPGIRRLLAIIPLAVCWGVWKVRNSMLFDNINPMVEKAIGHALDLLRMVSVVKPFKIRGPLSSCL